MHHTAWLIVALLAFVWLVAVILWIAGTGTGSRFR